MSLSGCLGSCCPLHGQTILERASVRGFQTLPACRDHVRALSWVLLSFVLWPLSLVPFGCVFRFEWNHNHGRIVAIPSVPTGRDRSACPNDEVRGNQKSFKEGHWWPLQRKQRSITRRPPSVAAGNTRCVELPLAQRRRRESFLLSIMRV